MDTDVKALVDTLVNEILVAVGLPRTPGWHQLVEKIFRTPLRRLAQIALTFDRLVKEEGFSRAAQWGLKHWCQKVIVKAEEKNLPEGPLLVISNHPGTYDSLVLASSLRRDDACFIASAIPFLRNLPASRDHFFFISRTGLDRAVAVRQAICHLRDGKTLLLFGSGQIDPDPAVYPFAQAKASIRSWSASIELFLRMVPETRVMVSIISHVVSPRWRYSLLYWLRKKAVDRRRIVEFAQVLSQLFSPGRWMLTPRITLTSPQTMVDLGAGENNAHVMPAVIRWGENTLAEHVAWANLLLDPRR